MATTTYEPIQTQTLGSAAASVTFSSISQGYTDIRAVVVTAVNTATFMRFNSDTGNNYSLTEMWAGTSPVSERATNISRMDLRNSSSTLGNNMATVDIMGYSNSTTYKTVLTAIRDGLYDRVYRQVQLWRNTAAITTITFVPDSGNFPTGSTFTLYGIANVGGDTGLKANGGIITSDSTYWYHTFLGSNTFTPNQSLTADILVVAGGGSGSAAATYADDGGGGAGGVIAFASQSLTAQGYPVLVGAGGAGTGSTGNNGSDSQFSTLTAAVGGGRGGKWVGGAGAVGGSGGGGAASYSGIGTRVGGAGTSGQGNAGGNGTDESSGGRGGGGGGGAGSVGANAVADVAGAGGSGTNSVTNWGSLSAMLTTAGLGVGGYIAGGGGGANRNGNNGAGGAGGGSAGYGNNGSTSGSASAVANTGSGSGASVINSPTVAAGNGGSGIVIIRYLKA